jgi:four helix bundle protein
VLFPPPEPEPVTVAVTDDSTHPKRETVVLFDFEKLYVDQVALDFIVSADEVTHKLPRRRRYLKGQLLRAANSIAANTAEGVGEDSPTERVRFDGIARRSAVECASHLVVSQRLDLVRDDDLLARGRDNRLRIVAMLTSLARSISEKNTNRR